jgi:hypothetical protein
VRGEHGVVVDAQRVVRGQRFGVGHVQRGPVDLASLQRVEQGRGIHQRQRAVLTSQPVGFITFSSAGPMRWRFRPVSGTCRDTTSACASSSSSEASQAHARCRPAGAVDGDGLQSERAPPLGGRPADRPQPDQPRTFPRGRVPVPGTLLTTMPRRVAYATSMLSTPTP